MQVPLRREYAKLVTSGAQLLLLFAGILTGSRDGWLYSLAAIALISLFAWFSALKRLRIIRDTPTSKVASAAQGYVELIGRGKPLGMPMLSKLNLLPCLWYRYQIEFREAENKWKIMDSGETTDSFMLRDETGSCVIDPDQAEIITRHRDRWTRGDYRYTEWKLIGHDTLYVIGQFHTHNCGVEFDSRAKLNEVLTAWKQDLPSLHKRFDLNNDGELDMKEWFLARQAAKREVAKQRLEAQQQADLNIISRPADGKLFLISNLSEKKLSRRYLIWAWLHLAIFFAALAAIEWVWKFVEF